MVRALVSGRRIFVMLRPDDRAYRTKDSLKGIRHVYLDLDCSKVLRLVLPAQVA
jgi:hypothetical protein